MMTRREALASLTVPLASATRLFGQSSARGRLVIPGRFMTFLIETDGTVKAWSYSDPLGSYLGLGHTNRVEKYLAYEVPGLRNVVAGASTGRATYALIADGRILAWGSNARGEVGYTPLAEVEVTARGRTDALSPTPVLNVSDAIAIAAGDDHALAVTRAGDVYVWGYNLEAQLGIETPIIKYKTHSPGRMNYLSFPVKVPTLSGVKAVAAGHAHSLALLGDGTIRAWGSNKHGQLGDGATANRPAPVTVSGIRNAVAIAAGGWLSAAILADGRVMTWGHGNSGLGRKAFKRDYPHSTPALVDGVSAVRELAIGSIHMLALTEGGTVLSWGDQMAGEVGHPGTEPRRVTGLTNVKSIAAVTGGSFAVVADNTIMVWGGVPFWARIDGGDPDVARWPIPLVIRNLKNPI